jgi:hypothetical protein
MGRLHVSGAVGLMALCLVTSCKRKPAEDDDPSHTVVVGAVPSDDSDKTVLPASAREPEGVLIPRSMTDKGRYYLLAKSQKDGIITAVHKRVGVDSVVWTRTQTDCATMLMREMGNTEEGRDKIPRDPTKWFELVKGSSKSDLARFLCKR